MSQPPLMSLSASLVSVLMAVYNSERYVAQAVESILNQTFQDFELIIIDDGSRDRSLSILQQYADRDPRIRLIHRENQGISRTRNQLLAEATGEFIAVMDSDDVSLPDRLKQQVDFLRQHPEVVCVGGAQEWIDEAGRFLLHRKEVESDAEIQQQMLVGHTCINNPSAMMRRSAVLQVGGYDESLAQAEDLDLFLKLGERGQLANLPNPVLQYRQHCNSISEQRHREHLEQQRIVCERAWQRRGITGLVMETQPWRPVDRPSRHRFMTMYGWWFFNRGQRSAAIDYAIKAIQALPFNPEGWKLLACALIKPLPQPS